MLYLSNLLFKHLNNSNIKYCHWKSNEHLLAGLRGDTDLDILVDRKSCTQLYTILNNLNFIRGKGRSYLSYTSIEDFIGFDKETGKLIHLHIHYELMIGKKFIKGLRLPWEKIIFDTTIENNTTYHTRTINPNIEIILLILRNVLKRHSLLKKSELKFPNDEMVELEWLKEHIENLKIQEFSCNLINEDFAEKLIKFLKNNNYKNNVNLYKSAFYFFKKQFNLSSVPINLTYYFKKFQAAVSFINFKKLDKPIPYRRTLPQGGLVITFVGVDGSGKSTLIKIIKDWLSWKLDVSLIYFGSGDGKSSLLRLPIKIVAQFLANRRGNIIERTEKEVHEKNSGALKKIAKNIWAITLAMEKKAKLFKMLKARSKGLIVLTDRFPQTQTEGYNDGPLLGKWKTSKSKLKKKIADWEYNIYNLANYHSPDILIKLFIPAELAVLRKNDTPLFMLEKKIDVINKMEYGKNTLIIKIDSSKTVEKTELEIKQLIWQTLNGL